MLRFNMTRSQLTDLMFTKGVAYVDVMGARAILQSILREDGSGRSFIMGIVYEHTRKASQLLVRVID